MASGSCRGRQERLAQAVERLPLAATEKEKSNRALEYDDYLFLSIGERSRFLKVRSIKCVCTAGVYSEIYTADSAKVLVHRPLNEWEERLPAKNFLRIHRSTIINIEYVEEIKKWFNYSYQVQLRGINEPFIMSRRYAAKLKEAMT